MDKYVVKLYACAYRDLDGIYTYIAKNLLQNAHNYAIIMCKKGGAYYAANQTDYRPQKYNRDF